MKKAAGALLAALLCYTTQGAQIPCNTPGHFNNCYVNGQHALCQAPPQK
jgi:hypothetical protein